jgi:hypothetical protein
MKFGCRVCILPSPKIQTVDIGDIEIAPLGVISAPSIQVYGRAVRQYPDEARHLRSGTALVYPDAAEFFVRHTVNIEAKNAGLRESHVFFAKHLRAEFSRGDDDRTSNNL